MQDLSVVTDVLLGIITAAMNDPANLWSGPAPFSVEISGQHPENPGASDDCEVSMYLFHVAADRFQRSTFWTQSSQSAGNGKQPIAFEPLALDLWYMLSAQSKTSYAHEQQVLGVAMRALHEHGTFTIPKPTPPPGSATPSQAALVLESPTFDELSKLWQAIGLPLRTTAQYRVSVVFLFDGPPPPPAPPAEEYVVNTTASLPQLLSTRRSVTYTLPGAVSRTYAQQPATLPLLPAAVVDQGLRVDARMLEAGDRLLLKPQAGAPAAEVDVSAWMTTLAPPYPSPVGPGIPFLLRAPDPAPIDPGTYELSVSRPDVPGFRSAPLQLRVAAWIDPAPGPEIPDTGGLYSFDARGIPSAAAGSATVRLGPTMLARIADGNAPGPGEWQHQAGTVTLRVPAGTPAGSHRIGLRVNEIESDPALWAVVP